MKKVSIEEKLKRRRNRMAEKKAEKINKEIARSQATQEVWIEDNGRTFKCKFCRSVRPVDVKSKEKTGWCRLCTGGK